MVPDNNRKNSRKRKKKSPMELLTEFEIDPLFYERPDKLKKEAPIRGRSPSKELPNPPPRPTPTVTYSVPPTPPPFTATPSNSPEITPTPTTTITPTPTETETPTNSNTNTPNTTPTPTETSTPSGSPETTEKCSAEIVGTFKIKSTAGITPDVHSEIYKSSISGKIAFYISLLDEDLTLNQINSGVTRDIKIFLATSPFAQETLDTSNIGILPTLSLATAAFSNDVTSESNFIGIHPNIEFHESALVSNSKTIERQIIGLNVDLSLYEAPDVTNKGIKEAQESFLQVKLNIYETPLVTNQIVVEQQEAYIRPLVLIYKLIALPPGATPITEEPVNTSIKKEIKISKVDPSLFANSFLFYAPIGSTGTNNTLDYVSLTTSSAIFRNYDASTSTYVFESFEDFIDRRLLTTDRITTYTHDICGLKSFYPFVLNFPQGTGQSSSSIGVFLAHPTSLPNKVQTIIDDDTNVYGVYPTNGVTTQIPAPGTPATNLFYGGVLYRLYRLMEQNPGLNLTVRVNTCI